MKIAFCDDCQWDLQYLKEMLEDYKKNIEEECFLFSYTNSSKLYNDIMQGKTFDLFILDMLMPEKSGIDLGKAIRATHKQVVIIYTTSSKDYALAAYGVHAQRYLVKPIQKEELFEALDFAGFQSRESGDKFLLKTCDGIQTIPYVDIEYLECVSRMIQVTLADGTQIRSVLIRQSFETALEQVLSHPFFLQTHKSYVVNMQEVASFSQKELIMKNQVRIPISKNRQIQVRRQYLAFLAAN
ncbi:MAG: LytTR family DNA-binding domain-containing protein [Lachnospiraceae bacterium]